MSTRTRISSFFLGVLSVGVVIAALALAGVFGDDDDRTTTTATAPAPTTTVSTPGQALDVAGIYERVSPGVVFVSARGGNGRLDFQGEGGGQAASGSGFLIDGDGYIVTNDHVVENASEYAVRFGEDGEAIPAKLVGADPRPTSPLLKVDPAKLPERRDAARAGELRRAARGRPGRRHRQPVRAGGHRHHRHRLRAGPQDPVARTASRSRASCRPTPRSTPATPAARCSTTRAA